MSTKGHAAHRYVGTNAERAALATGGLVAGAVWIETDTAAVFVWTGTDWKEASIDTQAHIIDADGTLADITTKYNTLLSQLETMGILASS